jgi:ATP synthase protein I
LHRSILKIIGLQVIISAVAAVLAFLLAGALAARSVFLGGAIGFIPSAAYGVLVLRKPFGTPQGLLQRQYLGEFSKLVLTLALFGATFAWVKEISVPLLFAGYALTLAVYWAALLLIR